MRYHVVHIRVINRSDFSPRCTIMHMDEEFLSGIVEKPHLVLHATTRIAPQSFLITKW